MTSIKITLAIVAASTMFVACSDGQKEMAQKKVDSYAAYIDSVSNIAAEKAAEDWQNIEADYQAMKTDVSTSIQSVKEHSGMQNAIDKSTLKYEKFKAEVVAAHDRIEAERSKTKMRESLLGSHYIGGDMAFTWINKNNILGVYQNFIDTVDKNKDTYSREDWDEIKLLYEAIDTRKNTVEKEGISSADNMKIAALKLKFASMYTVSRIGAKSKENAEAKQ